jgi:branched-chain amino acid transport system substrate-binding protein
MEQSESLDNQHRENSVTRRQFLTLLSATTGAIALSACQQAPDQPATRATEVTRAAPAVSVQREPVKLGILAARAGITATVGEAGLRATQWWADRVNRNGGVLGRPIELIIEEETSPRETVDRYRKLALRDRVEAVFGIISTAVGLAVASTAEEVGTPLFMWDGTTQQGVKETMPHPKWVFRSVDNEVEALIAAILTTKYFKDVRKIAGINNDYSYGWDNWETFQAVLNHYAQLGRFPKVEFVEGIFTKLGETEFTSHVRALQSSGADVVFCSFWSGDAPILLKQAAGVGLFRTMKGVFCTAGGVLNQLSKDFTPEGLLIGYNSMYFADPQASDLLKEFVRDYYSRYNEYPVYEADHAYMVAEVWRAAVEKAAGGSDKWPDKEEWIKAAEGIEVESLLGKRTMLRDHRMSGTFFQGISTHRNQFDFVTIDPIERVPVDRVQKPQADMDLYSWINSWRVGPDGLPTAA